MTLTLKNKTKPWFNGKISRLDSPELVESGHNSSYLVQAGLMLMNSRSHSPGARALPALRRVIQQPCKASCFLFFINKLRFRLTLRQALLSTVVLWDEVVSLKILPMILQPPW